MNQSFGIPVFWNTRFVNKNTPWDPGEPSPSILELEKKLSLDPKKTNVLFAGAGAGRDIPPFLQKGYSVTALDWSPSGLEDLKKLCLEKGTPLERLQLISDDFFKWEPKDKFDLCIEHTFFCAIDPKLRKQYVSKMTSLLKSAGILMGVFLIEDPCTHHSFFSKIGSPPFPSEEMELKKLFSAYKIQLLERTPVPQEPFGSAEWWAIFSR